MPYQINEVALEKAIAYSRNKWTYSIGEDLLRSLIYKMEEEFHRLPFGEAQRYTLNELRIYNRRGTRSDDKRDAYRSASSRYFSENASLKRAAQSKRRKANLPQKKPKVAKTSRAPRTKLGKKNQYEFMI
jgi:hypothetical protein